MSKKIVLVILLILCVQNFCFAEKTSISVAKIQFREVEPLLLELVFSKPENKELKDSYQTYKELEDSMMRKALEMQETGEFNPMDFTETFSSSNMDEQKKIENLVKGELIVLIEKLFGKQYQVIISESYQDNILYTDIVIPDITANIRQYLLKLKITGVSKE